jgi:hypothetical protein
LRLSRKPSFAQPRSYDALLSSLCDASGLIVVATPYDLATDHDAIAVAAATKLRGALAAVAATEGYSLSALPLFGAGHSLGAKLQLLMACGSGAEGAPPPLRYEAQCLIAFNNASASDSVRLVEKFARELLASRAANASAGGGGGGGGGADARLFETLLRSMPAVGAMAERAVAVAGLEFTPAPAETLARAQARFKPRAALLVKLEKDELDQARGRSASLCLHACTMHRVLRVRVCVLVR